MRDAAQYRHLQRVFVVCWSCLLITGGVVGTFAVSASAMHTQPVTAQPGEQTYVEPATTSANDTVASNATAEPAAKSLTLEPTIPARTTIDNETQIPVTVTVPDIAGVTLQSDLTLSLTTDGSLVNSTTRTVTDGSSTTFELPYNATRTGTQTVNLTGTVQYDGPLQTYTFTQTVERQLEVDPVTGTTFTIPDTLADEVNATRATLPSSSPYAGVLATDEQLHVVLADTPVDTGRATVHGRAVNMTVEHANTSFGVLVARNLSVRTRGIQQTVDAVSDHPKEYHGDLVNLSANRTRAGIRYDPDQGANISAAASVGLLTTASTPPNQTVRPAYTAAEILTAANGTQTLSAAMGEQLDTPEHSHLYTITPGPNYWLTSPTTVDGVVLAPASPARRFVEQFIRPNASAVAGEAPVVYVINDRVNANRSVAFETLTEHPSQFTGEIVTTTAHINGTRISVQETLEHETACGPTRADLGNCTDIPVDMLLHTGLAWNWSAETGTDTLPIVGISSLTQEQPRAGINGRHRLTGRIVTAERVDGVPGNGSVLVVGATESLPARNESPVPAFVREATRQRLLDFTVRLDDAVAPELFATRTQSGAVFPVPPSLEDEVATLRTDTTGLGTHATVIAGNDTVSLVFSQRDIEPGRANITGISLNRSLSVPALEQNVSVLLATNVTQSAPRNTTVEAVTADPEAYRRAFVRLHGHHRQIATVTDPDGDANITLSTTAGRLHAQPPVTLSLLQRPGAQVRGLLQNSSRANTSANASATVERLFTNTTSPTLPTVSFRTAAWVDANVTVTGIVLAPDSAAGEYARAISPAGVSFTDSAQPVLYVTDAFEPVRVANVSTLSQQASTLDGEIVSVEARLIESRLSVQESLEHATTSQCTVDKLRIQTSQGSVCINVVQDALLHAGVGWNGVPTDRNETLFVVGVSSTHQDTPTRIVSGRYNLVGEVVSTSRIDPELPPASVLLVYERQRLAPLNETALANETQELVRSRTDTLREPLQNDITSSDTTLSPISVSFVSTVNNAGAPIRVAVNVSVGPIEQLQLTGPTGQTVSANTTNTIITVTPSSPTAIHSGDYASQPISISVVGPNGTTYRRNVSTAVYPAGDTDGNGQVDVYDAVAVGQHWLAKRGSSDFADSADLNNDGRVSIADAALVGRQWD